MRQRHRPLPRPIRDERRRDRLIDFTARVRALLRARAKRAR